MFPSSYHHEIFRSCYQWQMWRPCKSSRSGVVIHSILKLFTFCKTLLKIQVFVQKVFCKYSFKQQSLFKSNLARLNDGRSSPSVGVTNSCEVIEIIFFHSVLRKSRNDGTFIISFPSAFNNKVIFHSDGCVFLVRPKQDVSFLWSHDLSRDWQKVDRNGHAFRRDWMG